MYNFSHFLCLFLSFTPKLNVPIHYNRVKCAPFFGVCHIVPCTVFLCVTYAVCSKSCCVVLMFVCRVNFMYTNECKYTEMLYVFIIHTSDHRWIFFWSFFVSRKLYVWLNEFVLVVSNAKLLGKFINKLPIQIYSLLCVCVCVCAQDCMQMVADVQFQIWLHYENLIIFRAIFGRYNISYLCRYVCPNYCYVMLCYYLSRISSFAQDIQTLGSELSIHILCIWWFIILMSSTYERLDLKLYFLECLKFETTTFNNEIQFQHYPPSHRQPNTKFKKNRPLSLHMYGDITM